jgi:hypothetical protein
LVTAARYRAGWGRTDDDIDGDDERCADEALVGEHADAEDGEIREDEGAVIAQDGPFLVPCEDVGIVPAQ